MRKKVAALLCAIMCIAAFTGCSSAELGYLQMGADLLTKMEVSETKGTVNIELDADAMKDYVAGISGVADEATKEELSAFTGKKSAVIDYAIKMDMSTLAYQADLDITYAGTKYDLGDMYFGMKDGIYVSGKTVWGAYELTKAMVGENGASYLKDENFAKDLKAITDGSGYINLMSMEEMGLTEEDLAEVIPTGGYGDLYASAMDFYKNAFSGFTTNMVSEVSGGYKIKTDGKAVAQLFVDVLDYIGNNPDTVLAATTDYMMDVMKAMNTSEEDMASFKEELEATAKDAASFKAGVDQIKAAVEQGIAQPEVSKVLDSFSYESTITKAGDGFNTVENFAITDGGKSVLKITGNSTVKASSGKIVMPANSVSTEDFEKKLTALDDKYNPVNAVVALWGWEGDSEAMLTLDRAEESFFANANGVNFVEYVEEDGRVYLPLRDICEALGETVEWNNDEKTAYIVRDGEKTAMQGKIQDGKSFISVRDFEKLGYTVAYEKVEDLKQVTVTK
mgnify:CR=1 FL=1